MKVFDRAACCRGGTALFGLCSVSRPLVRFLRLARPAELLARGPFNLACPLLAPGAAGLLRPAMGGACDMVVGRGLQAPGGLAVWWCS